MVQLKLVAVVICIYNEILRANKVYKGLEEGKSAMPAEGSVFFIPVLIAILKVIPTTHSSEIRGLCLMKCSSGNASKFAILLEYDAKCLQC